MKKLLIMFLFILLFLVGWYIWINKNPNNLTVISIKEKLSIIPVVKVEKNERYSKTKTGVLFIGNNPYVSKEKLLEVDLYSFEFLTGWYAKDKNIVFYNGEALSGIDSNSFLMLSWQYSKDSKHIFYEKYMLSWADVASFEIMDPDYSKDKNNVYYKENMISWADSQTIQLVTPWEERMQSNKYGKKGYSDYKDKNNEYVGWLIIQEDNNEEVKVDFDKLMNTPWIKKTIKDNPLDKGYDEEVISSLPDLISLNYPGEIINGFSVYSYRKPTWYLDFSITEKEKDVFISKWTCPRDWLCKKKHIKNNVDVLYGLWLVDWYDWDWRYIIPYINIYFLDKQAFFNGIEDLNVKWLIKNIQTDYENFIEAKAKEYNLKRLSDFWKRWWANAKHVHSLEKDFMYDKIMQNGDSIQKSMQYVEKIVDSIEIK